MLRQLVLWNVSARALTQTLKIVLIIPNQERV